MFQKNGKSHLLITSLILSVFFFSGIAMGEEDIVVYAPKGLKSVFTEIEKEFEKEYDITVKTVFLVHNDLEKTIKAMGGDLLVSVYPSMNSLERDVGDIMENPIRIAYLESLIFLRKDNPNNIKTFKDLGKPGIRLLVMDRKGKPFVGTVERTIAESSIAEEIKKNTVKSHENGTKVLRWLIAGEGDAAIAVKSLSTWDEFKELKTLRVPTAIRETDQVFISELTSSKLFDKLKVNSYINFVLSSKGKGILIKYGYSIPR